MPEKRYAGFHKDVVEQGRNIGFVEVRGYIYGCQYSANHFEGRTNEEILDEIRKDYRENKGWFKPYNQSNGYFIYTKKWARL